MEVQETHLPNGADADALAEKVAFLSAPSAYAPPPREVRVIETHMAWVFLAGTRVYKLKKPVRYPFLDFSTLARRERSCREEDRLNRRLAPDVYLGVVPLTREADGHLAVDGAGRPVDWLVRMRRLPAARMVDQAIGSGTLERRHIEALADVLARFYAGAERAAMPPEAYLARFERELEESRRVLRDPAFALPPASTGRVLEAIAEFLAEHGGLLAARAREGRIVDGHGDLRPEHVCLLEPPVVIDCLEFNRDLRLVDPFDDLALFGLECAQLGAPWAGDLLTGLVGEALGDRPPPALLAFYRAYRACLRARLALAHLTEPAPRQPGKWRPLAEHYLRLASQDGLTPRRRADRQSSRSHGSA